MSELKQVEEEVREEGENETLKLGSNLVCGRGDHYFEYKTGLQAECNKCPLGYPIGPDINIREGHIYIEEQLII